MRLRALAAATQVLALLFGGGCSPEHAANTKPPEPKPPIQHVEFMVGCWFQKMSDPATAQTLRLLPAHSDSGDYEGELQRVHWGSVRSHTPVHAARDGSVFFIDYAQNTDTRFEAIPWPYSPLPPALATPAAEAVERATYGAVGGWVVAEREKDQLSVYLLGHSGRVDYLFVGNRGACD